MGYFVHDIIVKLDTTMTAHSTDMRPRKLIKFLINCTYDHIFVIDGMQQR